MTKQTKSAGQTKTNGNGNGNGNGKNGNGNGKNGNGKSKGWEERARTVGAAQSRLCQMFVDLRLFGGTLAGGRDDGGYNAGSATGPIQMKISDSVNIPHITEYAITRVAIANEALAESRDANQTMGRKAIANYALFCTEVYVDPFRADVTGLTNRDLGRFWDDLLHLFDHDASASRPSMNVRKLIIAKHQSKRGDCPTHVLDAQIRIQPRVQEPQNYDDFEVTVGTSPTPNVELFVIEPWPEPEAAIARVMAGLAEDAVIGNRYKAWLIWEAIQSNPNGDPDNANHPRVSANTHRCEVTDVCLKRKVRNRLVMVHGLDIYVREGSVLSLNRKTAYDDLGLNAPPPPSGDDAADDDSDDAVS